MIEQYFTYYNLVNVLSIPKEFYSDHYATMYEMWKRSSYGLKFLHRLWDANNLCLSGYLPVRDQVSALLLYACVILEAGTDDCC